MSDRLEQAQRRWEHIRPLPGNKISQGKPEELAAWLEHDAGGVVLELVERPDFRSLARWSIENLTSGSNSEERQLVDAVDAALIGTARAMSDVIGQIVTASDAHQSGSELDAIRVKLDSIGTRPWCDLVSADDFFGPSVELNLLDRQASVCAESSPTRIVEFRTEIADFKPWCRPLLRLPGDFVVQCFETRVKYWKGILQRLFVAAQAAILRSQPVNWPDEGLLREAIQDSNSPFVEFRKQIHDAPESRKRAACVTLVQAYAAFRPTADLTWLGLPARNVSRAAVFKSRVERQGDVAIADSVASALIELTDFYRQDVDVESLIVEMATSHRLCLIDGRGRRDAYWEGQPLEIDWMRHGRVWTLLKELADSAKASGQGIDEASGLGISLRDARGAMRRLLPSALDDCIERNAMAYRLTLEPAEIYSGQFTEHERLEEVMHSPCPIR